MAAYSPTAWVNDQAPALNATNLNKLTDELESQAAAKSISHSLPTWANGAAPALTEAAPLNEIERVVQAVAQSVSLTYTPTAWQNGWTPARNATRLNRIEQQLEANRAALDAVPPPVGTVVWDVDYADGTASEWMGGGAHGQGGYSGATSVQFYAMENRNGRWAAKHTLLAGGVRSEFGLFIADTTQNVDRFWGTEIELPSNHNWASVGTNGINITQHDQSNGQASAPFHINIGAPRRQPRGIVAIMQTGTWEAIPVFGSGLEYVSGDTSWAGHTIANPVIIASDQVPLGVPIQIILRSFRTGVTSPLSASGRVQTWWKTRGEPQTAWRAGTPNPLSQTDGGQGFPTLQHYPGTPYNGHETYNDSLSHKWGVYAGAAVPATFTMWHYRALMGTSFEAVASRLT